MTNEDDLTPICPVCEDEFASGHQRGGHLGAHHSDKEKRAAVQERLQQYIEQRGNVPTLEETANSRWASRSTFESLFGSWSEAIREAGHEPDKTPHITIEKLLDELHRLEEKLDKTPTQKEMDRRGLFSSSAYHRQFGSWNKALLEAGYDPNHRTKIGSDELLSDLTHVADTMGKSPTKTEYNDRGSFCSLTFLNRFGGWANALEKINRTPSRHDDFSKQELIEDLQRVEDELDRTPTINDAAQLATYGTATFEREFGSWNDALRTAGFEVNNRTTISKEELSDALRELRERLGSVPTVKENRNMGSYSLGAYQREFGSWNEAIRATDMKPNDRNDIPRRELLEEIRHLVDTLDRSPSLLDILEFGKFSMWTYQSRFGSWSSALETAGVTAPRDQRDRPHPLYGKGWNDRIRTQVLQRDDYSCVSCGQSQTSHREEYGRGLSVHHICGAKTSTNPAVFNAPRNLVTLCTPCHKEAEPFTPGLPSHIDQPGPISKNKD